MSPFYLTPILTEQGTPLFPSMESTLTANFFAGRYKGNFTFIGGHCRKALFGKMDKITDSQVGQVATRLIEKFFLTSISGGAERTQIFVFIVLPHFCECGFVDLKFPCKQIHFGVCRFTESERKSEKGFFGLDRPCRETLCFAAHLRKQG